MDKYVLTMGLTRFILGLINLSGALLMFRYQTVENALRINGILGSIGPFVLLFVSSVGLAGLAGQIPISKVALILLGVVCILLGTR